MPASVVEMKRKLHIPHIPDLNPVLMDLVLVVAVSFMMSVVFITAAYMIYVRVKGS